MSATGEGGAARGMVRGAARGGGGLPGWGNREGEHEAEKLRAEAGGEGGRQIEIFTGEKPEQRGAGGNRDVGAAGGDDEDEQFEQDDRQRVRRPRRLAGALGEGAGGETFQGVWPGDGARMGHAGGLAEWAGNVNRNLLGC